ncbi:lipoprotein [Streptococcus criceti]|nr:lipoprotein [Streptococcus criceti]
MGLASLSACGLNKDSRSWIEKNRVSDIYKVYPTKDPEDLFKVFPDGFNITQFYTNSNGVYYHIEFEGNAKTGKIKGQFVKEPYSDDKREKLSDVTVEDGQIIFSNETAKKDWLLEGFLFQHLTINQAYLNELKEKKHSYNSNSGIFHINYKLTDPRVNKLLKKDTQKITDFEITGSGEDYYNRAISFTFSDNSEFGETINRLNK